MHKDFAGRALVLSLAVAGVTGTLLRPAWPQTPTAVVAPSNEFTFHHAEVLGTSLDLTVVVAASADAAVVEKAVLDEIARCSRILSTYDPGSEVAKLNATPPNAAPIKISAELFEVLAQYDAWNTRSAGAYSGHLGGLVKLWKKAEQDNQLPDHTALAALVAQLAKPAWHLNASTNTLQRLSAQEINIDSLGKGYIVDRAIAAAKKKVPALVGLLVNIGGDIRVCGSARLTPTTPWRIGVADPAHHEDNAAPLTTVLLRDRAVATSAAYERFYTIGQKKYSHILDPRTGQPASSAQSATVIARDDATANALATLLCILTPPEALRLVQGTPGADCLIVTAAGKQLRTGGFAAYEVRPDPKIASAGTMPSSSGTTPAATGGGGGGALAAAGGQWPKGFQVTINVDISVARRSPYHYVWVTDAKGNYVTTVAAYGNERKYVREMRDWYRFVQADSSLMAVTRATRRPGQYSYVWNGTDQKGRSVPPGTYEIHLECAWEKGPNSTKSATIVCQNANATAKIERAPAFNEGSIVYGPGKGT